MNTDGSERTTRQPMPAPLHVAIPPITRLLAPIRSLVSDWLESCDLEVDQWPLVVTELLTNSLLLTPPEESVELDMHVEADRVVLVVSDPGPGFELGDHDVPSRTSHRGRGLSIVSALTDEFRAERRSGRTFVTCVATAHARFPEMTAFLDQATHNQRR